MGILNEQFKCKMFAIQTAFFFISIHHYQALDRDKTTNELRIETQIIILNSPNLAFRAYRRVDDDS